MLITEDIMAVFGESAGEESVASIFPVGYQDDGVFHANT